MLILRSSAPTSGRVDSLPLRLQKKSWSQNGSCVKQGNHRWALERPKSEGWIVIWEEVRRIHQGEILLKVDHVKAHRAKKEMQDVL